MGITFQAERITWTKSPRSNIGPVPGLWIGEHKCSTGSVKEGCCIPDKIKLRLKAYTGVNWKLDIAIITFIIYHGQALCWMLYIKIWLMDWDKILSKNYASGRLLLAKGWVRDEEERLESDVKDVLNCPVS